MRLKEIREQRNLKSVDVARGIGCSTTVYSRYENGKRQPSIEVLLQLSEFLEVSVDYLLGREPVEAQALSDYERELVRASRNAPANVREDVLDFLRMKDLSRNRPEEP